MNRYVVFCSSLIAVAAVCAVSAVEGRGKHAAPAKSAASAGPSNSPEKAPAAFRKRLGTRSIELAAQEAQRRSGVQSLGFEDDADYCVAPEPVQQGSIDVDKSLFVHDTETLGAADGPFALEKTLQALAQQASEAGAVATAGTIFRDLWDTQNTAPGSGGGQHCDDEPSPIPVPNFGGLNGYPVRCRVADGAQAGDAGEMGKYRAIALVNRLDLAHEGWRNCGEHRIVYGRTDAVRTHRNFIIFEAALPNPKPGCRSACLPVMEFWAGLSSKAPAERQRDLAKFYFKNDFLPGFRPVVHVDHFTAKGVSSPYGSSGGGQIRTNQFFEFPWLLKEFRLLLDCGGSPCAFNVIPTMVKVDPFGELWNQTVADAATGPFKARAEAFQAGLLTDGAAAVKRLASNRFDGIGYSVDLTFDAAESTAGPHRPPPPDPFPTLDDYLQRFQAGVGAPGGFQSDFVGAVPAPFTAEQIIHRAVGLSCAGCHQPVRFGLTTPGAIGQAKLVNETVIDAWPNSLGFVHVSEDLSGSTVFPISPALTDVFLPSRKANLIRNLNENACLCKEKFVKLPEPARGKALKHQHEARERLKAKLEALRGDLAKAGRPGAGKRRSPIAPRLFDMTRGQDAALTTVLKSEGIPVETSSTSLKVEPDRLDAASRAGGDAKKARALRQRAVNEQLKAEPPRRTVTGSYRVH